MERRFLEVLKGKDRREVFREERKERECGLERKIVRSLRETK